MSYVFGDFTVDPRQRLLARRSGEPVPIGDKAFDALSYLLQHPGQVVARATLAQALWPNASAAGNNLSQAIKALRFALGDAEPPHRYVATVQRRGYQFVADVLERASGERATPIETRIEEKPLPIAEHSQPTQQAAAATESPMNAPPSTASIGDDMRVAARGLKWRRGILPLATIACTLAIVLIITPFLRPRCVSSATVPDRIVHSPVSEWPSPPLVACELEQPGSMTLRCAAFRAAAKEQARRWKQGLQRT